MAFGDSYLSGKALEKSNNNNNSRNCHESGLMGRDFLSMAIFYFLISVVICFIVIC